MYFDEKAPKIPSCEQEKNQPFIDSRLNRLLETIKKEKFKAISFDVFDTLLTRMYWEPSDLFILMGKRPDVVQLINGANFSELRITCEKKLRLRLDAQKRDPSLLEIYTEIGTETDLDATAINKLMALEVELEVACVTPREAVKACWDAAKSSGKKIIVCTDMYLPQPCIERMLSKCGYEMPDYFFLSCDAGATKKHGTIYSRIIKETGFDASQILHVGDNKHSDNVMAEQAGLSAMHTPMVRDSLLQSKRRGLEGIVPEFARSSEIPDFATRASMKLIALKHFNTNFDGKFSETASGSLERSYGYAALGPFVLSLALWMRRHCITRQIDTLAFLARDGWLPQQALVLLSEVLDEAPKVIYLPISRRMIFPWLLHEPGGFERITKIGYGASLLVEDYLYERFGNAGLSVFKDFGGRHSEELLKHYFYDQEKFVYDTLRANLSELQSRSLDNRKRVLEFYQKELMESGNFALFDVGRKGTFQKVISQILEKNILGFYVINSYEIHKNASDRSFESFLGIIDNRVRSKNPDTMLYEALLSEQASGFVGIDNEGKAIRSSKGINGEQRVAYNEMHQGALDYIRDAISTYKSDITLLEQEPFYASYGLEHWTKNEIVTSIFSRLPHEDSVSESEPRNLADIFRKTEKKADRRLRFPDKTNRRRIAIYCPSMTGIRGGAERVTALIANELAARGDEVLVFSSGNAEKSISAVYPLDPRVFVRNVNVRNTDDIIQVIKSYNPDIGAILASGPVVAKVSYAFMTLEIPYILSERAEPTHSKETYWKHFSDDEYQKTHEAADIIALQFPSFASAFRSSAQRRIRILPNPIVFEDVPMSDPISERPQRILCAARIWFTQKRQDILLEAFALASKRNPKWRLDFYGEAYGNDAVKLLSRVSELKLNDCVSVNPATDNIRYELQNSSIFVIPSSFEGFPNALAEALSHGLPSVGFSSCPGVNELILDGKNGYLIRDRNEYGSMDTRDIMISKLAIILDKMMADSSANYEMSINAIESMKRYESKKVLSSWCQAFDELQSLEIREDRVKNLSKLHRISNKKVNPVDQRIQREDSFLRENESAVKVIKNLLSSLDLFLKLKAACFVSLKYNDAHRYLALSQYFGGNLTLPIPEDFDEEGYLRRNEDVESAVSSGKVQSGYMHYLRFGFDEGRIR